MKKRFSLTLFEGKVKENRCDVSPENVPDTKEDKASDRKARFEELIKGEFKDLYCEKIKAIVSKRLKGSELLRQKLEKADRIMDILADRYKADKNDIDAILKFVETDDSLIADNAKEKGIDPESYRYIKNLENENRYYKEMEQKSKDDAKMDEQMRIWHTQSEDTAREYPDFDLGKEMSEAAFVELIRNGVDIKTAYRVMHLKEITDAIRKESAAQAEKETTERLLSTQRRPVENGMSAQSPALIKTDVSKLTPQQRAAIAKRVAMGEKITF